MIDKIHKYMLHNQSFNSEIKGEKDKNYCFNDQENKISHILQKSTGIYTTFWKKYS